MKSEEKPRRWLGRFALVLAGALLTLIALSLTQPIFPFSFLRGNRVLRFHGPNQLRERFVLVRGSYEDIVEAAKIEFGATRSHTGSSDEVQFRRGSDYVLITKSPSTILRLDPEAGSLLGRSSPDSGEVVAVSYTFDPNVFKGVVDWVHGFFR